MSRLDELKKQYPQLNMSLFDLMTRLDSSKSYKYLPLFCKIFSKRFDPKFQYHKDDYTKGVLELHSSLMSKSISTDNTTDSQLYFLHSITDFFPNETFTTLKEFMHYMDNGKIQNKDVTSYSNIDEIRGAVSLASIKELDEEMANQVIKEYEDETWVAVRPLTFGASARYGSSTRWCTTYQREKQYFERYWRQGILVYFINKKTGYKFAAFKSLMENDLSFWNAEDSRVDFLSLDIDDYLYPIVKKILSSDQTNKNLCSDEIQEQVHMECIEAYELKKMSISREEPMELAENPRQIVEAMMEAPEIEQPRDMGARVVALRARLTEALHALPANNDYQEEMQSYIPRPEIFEAETFERLYGEDVVDERG